jgi:excisionase family DNA binding protein
MADRMLAAKDAAETLGVSVDTLYRQWRPWGLKAFRVGSALKFRATDVNAWIERHAA